MWLPEDRRTVARTRRMERELMSDTERVVEPGENGNAENLRITIEIDRFGDARLGVNAEAAPVEVIYFYLHFMADALMNRHAQMLSQQAAQKPDLLVPNTDLLIPGR